MAGSPPRLPYRDRCPFCPDAPFASPMLIEPDSVATVVAEYVGVCGHVWRTRWVRDERGVAL